MKRTDKEKESPGFSWIYELLQKILVPDGRKDNIIHETHKIIEIMEMRKDREEDI